MGKGGSERVQEVSLLQLPMRDEGGRGPGSVPLRAVGQWDMKGGREREEGREEDRCCPEQAEEVQQGEAKEESRVRIPTCGWRTVLLSNEHHAKSQD